VRRLVRRLSLAAALALAVAALGWGALRLSLGAPYKGYRSTTVRLEVPPGSSTSAILGALEAGGVIRSRLAALVALRLLHRGRTLKAGDYRFTGPVSTERVLRSLLEGDVVVHRITLPEGLTGDEVALLLESHGLGSADVYRRLVRSPRLFPGIPGRAESLEGFLFPETYSLTRPVSPREVLARMVRELLRRLPEGFEEEASRGGLDLLGAVTLASLVEKETAIPSERPLVAAVYRNRLARGMLLQCDPTTVYALRRRGLWTGALTHDGLAVDDPYNTYVFAGLPPGPIASPGAAALEAAVAPADVPFLYFVAVGDGSGGHRFAVSYEEHLANVARLRRTRAAQETALGAPR